MSKLPVVLFAATLILIAGATVYEHQATPSSSSKAVAAAKKQIEIASSKSEYIPEVKAVTPSPAQERYLRSPASAHHASPTEPASVPLSASVLEQGLAAEKATNRTLVQNATILANSSSASQPSVSSPLTPKFIVQCLLTAIFCPLALFFILSKRFTVSDKNFAYTTIGTILGYWFASGA
jgi:hypothetical protein